jgi:hypothetical protein
MIETPHAAAPEVTNFEPREGDRPITTRPTATSPFPHQQLTQTAPVDLQEQLVSRVATLPHVVLAGSCVSVPGSRAFLLDEAWAKGPADAFQCRTEFAHIHPPADGSLHLTLPPAIYAAVLASGWGEPHPISRTMMLFGPRDQHELETVWQILLRSYRFAIGDDV